MRQAWTIARREFRGYFDHPTAYLLVVAFLALGLFLAFRSLFAQGVATLRGFFSLLPWLFSVFIPAITMRGFAEERRSGTYEWLAAQPVTELDLVAGKFVGDWLFALVALAGTLPAALGILLLSDADGGAMVAQYAGAALLAAQMTAIGLFASSATRNQITAFILAATLGFGLLLIGLDVVLIGLPSALAGVAARLSLVTHFENIARGVIDLRDALYFVSTAALFLGLAVLYADRREVIPMIARTDDLEYRLTSMIASMTTESKPRLAFLTGYGARDPYRYPALREVLAERYRIETVGLAGDSVPALSPDSFRVIVLAGPEQELGDAAVAAIEGYLAAGGSGLLLLEGGVVDPRAPFSRPVATGLDSLLARRGIRLARGMVYDLRSNERVSLGQRGPFNLVAPYPLWPVVLPAAEDHTLTRGLEALTLGWATALEVAEGTATALWSTTEFAGVRDASGPIMPESLDLAPDPAALAPRVVAAAVDGLGARTDGAAADDRAGDEPGGGDERAADDVTDGRIVVVGDADFLNDDFVRGNPQNLAFAANAVDWLTQDEALIAIRAKDRTPPPLVLESEAQQAALKWGNLLGVPLLFALGGVLRVASRRQLGGRSWEEVEG